LLSANSVPLHAGIGTVIVVVMTPYLRGPFLSYWNFPQIANVTL
jgi:hypothetical protein